MLKKFFYPIIVIISVIILGFCLFFKNSKAGFGKLDEIIGTYRETQDKIKQALSYTKSLKNETLDSIGKLLSSISPKEEERERKQQTQQDNPEHFQKRNSFSSKGELECKRAIESLTGEPFEKVRPDWFINPITKRTLELDCYNHDLKIAIEYDGQMHKDFNPYFHKNRDQFNNGKYRDYIKDNLCEKHGIHLIRVPHTIKIADIENYIMKRL